MWSAVCQICVFPGHCCVVCVVVIPQHSGTLSYCGKAVSFSIQMDWSEGWLPHLSWKWPQSNGIHCQKFHIHHWQWCHQPMTGGDSLTFNELAEHLNLEEAILKPLMHSLSCGKYKVIVKTPASNKINMTDSFKANTKFSCNMWKIHIPMASLDASHNTKWVKEDCLIAIEAAIVCIMKAKKTLQHQQLIVEVLARLAFFKPNPHVIKHCIEGLIEREYLEHSADNANVYNVSIHVSIWWACKVWWSWSCTVSYVQCVLTLLTSCGSCHFAVLGIDIWCGPLLIYNACMMYALSLERTGLMIYLTSLNRREFSILIVTSLAVSLLYYCRYCHCCPCFLDDFLLWTFCFHLTGS